MVTSLEHFSLTLPESNEWLLGTEKEKTQQIINQMSACKEN